MIPGHPGGPINTGSGGIKQIPLTCSGHTRPVVQLQFSPVLEDGSYLLISACKDGNPMLREWTGDWIGTFLGHKGAVWSTKLSLDSSRAASGSADFTAKVWDTYSGQPLHSFPHNHIVRTVALSPNAQRLLTGGQEKKARIFDVGRPDAEPELLLTQGETMSHAGTVKSVVWASDNLGVSAGEDGQIKWWDLRTRQLVHSLAFPDAITSMELSVQTNRLTVTSGKAVSFISAQPHGPPTHSLSLPYAPSSVSIHPIHQDRFVTGSTADEWVRVHGVDGSERDVLKGHHGPVHCVEFSPDGEMFASGSEDGTIRLWQTTPGKTYGLWQGQNGT